MKKWKLKEKIIHMGAFDYSVIVVIGDYGEACKYALWKCDDNITKPEDFGGAYEARGKCFFRDGYVPIIWVPKKPQTAREHATFAHEALHAVYHVFNWAGIPLSPQTEEVMAHCMAHIIANAL